MDPLKTLREAKEWMSQKPPLISELKFNQVKEGEIEKFLNDPDEHKLRSFRELARMKVIDADDLKLVERRAKAAKITVTPVTSFKRPLSESAADGGFVLFCAFCKSLTTPDESSDVTYCCNCQSNQVSKRRKSFIQLLSNDNLNSSTYDPSKCEDNRVPKQLRSLVKKCPQNTEEIVGLCTGTAKRYYRQIGYKQMEYVLRERKTLRVLWDAIKDETSSLSVNIRNKLILVCGSNSCLKLALQKRFVSHVESEIKRLELKISSLLYGHKDKLAKKIASIPKDFMGLMDMKTKAITRNDNIYEDELSSKFNELTNLIRCLRLEFPEIIKFIEDRSSIFRQYQLDLQKSGPQSIQTRREARRTRDNHLNLLGNPPSLYVPVCGALIEVEEVVIDSDKKVKTGSRFVNDLREIGSRNVGEFIF